jgi:hypothetical protein
MKQPLEWIGADLSASTRTKWIKRPPGAKKACIGIGWPATGTPVGTLSIEVSDHGKPGVAGAAYPVAITTNPSGTANTLILDLIETAADAIAMVYTRTSGGTGAVFTDSSGVAGTLPQITWME